MASASTMTPYGPPTPPGFMELEGVTIVLQMNLPTSAHMNEILLPSAVHLEERLIVSRSVS